MAFKRSAVRSRLSPPKRKGTPKGVPFRVGGDKRLGLTAHCNAMRGSDNPHFRQDAFLPRSAKRNCPIGAKNARFHGAA